MKYLILTLSLLMLAACGSDSPTDPGDGGGGGNEFVDTPTIPRPASPGGAVPAQSSILTRVTSGTLESFAPRVLDVDLASARIFIRPKTSCDWVRVEERLDLALSSWSGQVSYANLCGGASLSLQAQRQDIRPEGHMNLVNAGLPIPTVVRDSRGGIVFDFGPVTVGTGYVRTRITPANPLPETPYLRRDRYWRLRTLAGGVGDFLLLTGPTSGEISTTYSRGVERSQTETFGRSITGEVSASYGVVSASVSATLSEEFSSSVSISESRSETFTQTVRGEEGKTIQFMVWELVEVYSFTDAAGAPFTAEGWTFAADELVRTGAALALDATSFPVN